MCEQVAKKTLDVRFISREDKLAYVLTKPLLSPCFVFLKDKLHVAAALICLRGRVRERVLEEVKRKENRVHEDDKHKKEIAPPGKTPSNIQSVDNSNINCDLDKENVN